MSLTPLRHAEKGSSAAATSLPSSNASEISLSPSSSASPAFAGLLKIPLTLTLAFATPFALALGALPPMAAAGRASAFGGI